MCVFISPSSQALRQMSRGNSPVSSWCRAFGAISFTANSRARARSCCCSSVRAKSTMRSLRGVPIRDPGAGPDEETPPDGAGRPAAIVAILLLLSRLLRHLLLPLPLALRHLLGRHVLDVGGDTPVMAEG